MTPTVRAIEPPGVFIDSGGFIALHVSTDEHHAAAVACKDETLRFSRLYTSPNVISETIAHIQRDRLLDQQSLDDFITDMLQEGWIKILAVDDELALKALRRLKDNPHPRFSFVDAANIELMEQYQLGIIFAFDTFYEGAEIWHQHTKKYLKRIP